MGRSHNPRVVTAFASAFSPSVSAHVAKLTGAADEPGNLERLSGPDIVRELAPNAAVVAEFTRRGLVGLTPEESGLAVRKQLPLFAAVQPTAILSAGPGSHLIVIRPLELFTANFGVDVITTRFSTATSPEQYKMLKPLAGACRLTRSCASVLSHTIPDDGLSVLEGGFLAGSIVLGLAIAGCTVWNGERLTTPTTPHSPRVSDLQASRRLHLSQPTPYPLENNGRVYHSDPGKLVSYLGVAPPTTSVVGTIEKIDRQFWSSEFSAIAVVNVRGTDGIFYSLRTTPVHLDKSGFKVGDAVIAAVPKGMLTVYREGPPVIIAPRIVATGTGGEEFPIDAKTTAVVREVVLADGKSPWLILECGDGVLRRMPVTTIDLDKLGDLALSGKTELELRLTMSKQQRAGRKYESVFKDVPAETNLTSIDRK